MGKYFMMSRMKNTFFLMLLVFVFTFGQEITLAEHVKNNENFLFPQSETNAYANFCTGFYLMLDHRWEDAIEAFKKALQSAKYPEKIHNYLATCYFQLDKKDEAISHIEEIAQLKPNDFSIHYTLGSIYENEGNEEKAILEYERANNCDMSNINKVFVADMLYRLSNLCLKIGDLEKALNVYEKVLEDKLTNEPAKIYFRLGVINFEMKRFKEAIEQFTEARKYDSSLETITFYLAICYEELEDYEYAIIEISSYLRSQSDNWPLRISLSNLYETIQQYEKAESEREKVFELLKKNISNRSDNIREYIVLSQLFQRKGKNKQAIETLDSAVSNAKSNNQEDVASLKEVHLMMANLFYEMNEYRGVVSELRLVLQTYPDCHEASNFLGYFFVERGEKLGEALGLIEDALEFEPENGSYLDSLGWAYYKLATKNDDEKITLALQKLAEASRYTEDPEIIEHIGDVNYSLGLWGEAQKQWEHALKQWEKATKGLPPHSIQRSARELRAIRTVKEKLEKLKNLKAMDDSVEKEKEDKVVVSNDI